MGRGIHSLLHFSDGRDQHRFGPPHDARSLGHQRHHRCIVEAPKVTRAEGHADRLIEGSPDLMKGVGEAFHDSILPRATDIRGRISARSSKEKRPCGKPFWWSVREETRAFVSGLGMELGDFTRSDAQAGELIAGIRRMDDSSDLSANCAPPERGQACPCTTRIRRMHDSTHPSPNPSA